jgi:hydrogenase expression/formation protein HypC
MCLGVPGLVTKVDGDVVTLDVMGTQRTARLDLLGETVEVGTFVLHQLGFVTAKLEEEEARETLKLFEKVFESLGETGVRAPS